MTIEYSWDFFTSKIAVNSCDSNGSRAGANDGFIRPQMHDEEGVKLRSLYCSRSASVLTAVKSVWCIIHKFERAQCCSSSYWGYQIPLQFTIAIKL